MIHVEGAHGGVTPTGKIQIAVFNDRQPIPQQTIHEVASTGKVGDEVKEERITRGGIVREVEAELIIDLDGAKIIHQWLGDKIKECEGILKEVQKSKEEI